MEQALGSINLHKALLDNQANGGFLQTYLSPVDSQVILVDSRQDEAQWKLAALEHADPEWAGWSWLSLNGEGRFVVEK